MAFDTFRESFGAPATYRPYDEAARARLAGRLPDGLEALLLEDGFAVYADGLVTTCDPDDLEPAARAWFPDNPEVVLFGHGAFGDVFVWDGQEVGVLDPHVGQLDPVALDAEELFEMAFTRPSYRERALHAARAADRAGALGAPSWDEMFAYEPALALGGSGALDTVRRVGLVEHLVFLAQTVGLRG
jgi:hypothetical protein